MAGRNVDPPDEPAAGAPSAGRNVSSVTPDALRRAPAGRRASEWLRSLDDLPATSVSYEDAMAALNDARDETGTSGG
jgi:post-segregation antitoxin (ccd killing protein)